MAGHEYMDRKMRDLHTVKRASITRKAHRFANRAARDHRAVIVRYISAGIVRKHCLVISIAYQRIRTLDRAYQSEEPVARAGIVAIFGEDGDGDAASNKNEQHLQDVRRGFGLFDIALRDVHGNSVCGHGSRELCTDVRRVTTAQ